MHQPQNDVGKTGFEPAVSCTPSRRSTRLSHIPIASTTERSSVLGRREQRPPLTLEPRALPFLSCVHFQHRRQGLLPTPCKSLSLVYKCWPTPSTCSCFLQSGWQGSNLRRLGPKPSALPLSHTQIQYPVRVSISSLQLERLAASPEAPTGHLHTTSNECCNCEEQRDTENPILHVDLTGSRTRISSLRTKRPKPLDR